MTVIKFGIFKYFDVYFDVYFDMANHQVSLDKISQKHPHILYIVHLLETIKAHQDHLTHSKHLSQSEDQFPYILNTRTHLDHLFHLAHITHIQRVHILQ